MGAQDGRVPREVVKVVHDDGDKQVEHEKGAEKDEGNKVEVGDDGAALLLGVEHPTVGGVVLVSGGVALGAGLAGKHNVRPSLSRGATAKHLQMFMNFGL
jgi:hypothetical protein